MSEERLIERSQVNTASKDTPVALHSETHGIVIFLPVYEDGVYLINQHFI